MTSQTGPSTEEDRDELNLYLFKTMARNKMLAFKKIDANEFPLRQIPLDTLDILQEDDGFDHIYSAAQEHYISTSESARKKTKKKSKDS